MNGAELPSGSVLHVEPASSNSSSGACSQQQSPYGPPANAIGGGDATTKSQASHEQPSGDVKAKVETPAQADDDDADDEDLDDFFDSL
jgi:hypothetical protein